MPAGYTAGLPAPTVLAGTIFSAARAAAAASLRRDALLYARAMAASQGRISSTLGLHVSLAGQIGTASRMVAHLPGTISLSGRITAQSKAQCVSPPPPPRAVLTGWIKATSRGAAATISSSVRARQNDVSIIT